MIIKASLPLITLSFSLKDKLISLMRLTLRLFHRIKIFNLMRSHQTFRTYKFTNITFLNKIWSRYFIWKSNMRKARQKKMHAEDKILMMGYLLMRKRRNYRQRKQWPEKYFCFTILCHLLSLVVPPVVTWCTTRLSFYKRFFLYYFIKLNVYQILFVHSFSMNCQK